MPKARSKQINSTLGSLVKRIERRTLQVPQLSHWEEVK